MPTETDLIADRLKKIEELKKEGINPYPYRFERTHNIQAVRSEYRKLGSEVRTKDYVTLAGRLIALRRMGKMTFGHVQDETGRIQVLLRKDQVADAYETLKCIDRGDILGITGEVITTKTGELTVDVTSFSVLCKPIRPLPDKWGGLKDIEKRYRRRYLDLIMNPETVKTFQDRTKIIQTIRKVLDTRGFLEVDTPVLQPVYGGANAKPFETTLNALKMNVYLRIANELYLKRLLVGGIERVYEIARDFRNEDIDRSHNPEFSQVEFYQAYADLNDMMSLVEDIFYESCIAVHESATCTYGEHTIDFTRPWRRITMVDALKEFADIDVNRLSDNELFDLRTTYNLDIEGDVTRGKMIFTLFEELVEDKLIQPTFIIEHPVETTPLAKASRKTPGFVERFELYIAGMEMSNAYSELNDPVVQRQLLEAQAHELRGGSEEAHPMDEDFVQAIEYGMPPAGGVGIGIDRMVMVLTNSASIRDVIFFPFMKPKQVDAHD